MTEPENSITPYAPMALAPRPKLAIFERREDYPVLRVEGGEDRIVMPLRDYRKFRGDTRLWQFLCLCALGTVIAITAMVLLQPPIYVEKPFIVEKEKPVIVPSKCIIFCK